MITRPSNTAVWLRGRRECRTAVHEAGHATLALLERRQFQGVRLQKTADSNASISNIMCSVGDDDAVRIGLAGIMAARLTRVRWDSFLIDSARNDLGDVADFLRNVRRPECLLQWNIEATEKSLRMHWGAIEDIAARLIRTRSMSYQEVVQIFETSRERRRRAIPFGTLCKRGWNPLASHVQWRMKYPNGIADMMKEFGSGDRPDGGASLMED